MVMAFDDPSVAAATKERRLTRRRFSIIILDILFCLVVASRRL